MTAGLLAAAWCVLALGALADLARRAGSGRPEGPAARIGRVMPYVTAAIGSGLLCAAGATCIGRPATSISLGSSLGVGTSSLRLDPLTGLFLSLAGSLGAALSACAAGWAARAHPEPPRGTGAGYALLLGSMALVVCAGDAFTFLFSWESLTVSFYVLTAGARRGRTTLRASWATLAMGKVSGAALLLGLLLLSARSGTLTMAAWGQVAPGDVRATAFALLIAGFGAKVGLVPFEVWLPLGYPAAPGPLRAALAGLASNAGFYGLWRFLGILGGPPGWLVIAVLVVGGVTALVGVAFAAVETSLSRAISFSSVENAGLIAVGYGVALAGASTHDVDLVALALLAATLQVVAHSVAKTGLFASSALVVEAQGTDELEELRGVGRRDPVGGISFGLASLTLAGLPPTIGFVSEWLLLEALLQEFRLAPLGLRLGMAAAGALVALTAGVAALAFVRLIGLVVLGRPLSDPDAATGPTAIPTRRPPCAGRSRLNLAGGAKVLGLAMLAAPCLGLAAAAPWLVRFVADGLSPIVPHAATALALKSPWVLQPVFSGFSILSPSWLFVVLPTAAACTALGTIVLSGGGVLRIRRVPAWRSGSPGVGGPDRYGAFAYANALRHVLANVLGASNSVEVDEPASLSGDEDLAGGTHVRVATTIVEPAATYLYRPARALWLAAARLARRLQSGRLDAYIAYMLVALLAVLAAVAILR